MKKLSASTTALFLIISLLWAAPVSAGDAGQTAAEVLRMGGGARVPALGGAGVASARGATALSYNPGGLGFMNRELDLNASVLPLIANGDEPISGWERDLDASYYSLPEGINYGNIDYALSLPENTERERLFEGTWALGLRYLDYGSQDRVRRVSGVLKPDGSFSNSDLVLSAGYGQNWANWSYGVTARYVRQELDDVSGDAFSVDLGTRWNSRERPLSAGLVLANLGTDITFDEEDESLPELLRSGAVYRFYGLRLETSVDLEYQFESGEYGLMGGVEWWPFDRLALRAGYDGNIDLDDGLTAGFGYRHDDMSFDYAYLPYGDFGDVHRLGFRYQF